MRIAFTTAMFIFMSTFAIVPCAQSKDLDVSSVLNEGICIYNTSRPSRIICTDKNPITNAQRKILRRIEKACNGKNPEQCARVSLDHFNGEIFNAFDLFIKGCKVGNGFSCFALGYFYSEGIGVDADKAKALTLYNKACEDGNMNGCNHLGLLYVQDTGVGVDKAKAFTLFNRACNGGDTMGCLSLGYAYYNGDGVSIDKAKSAALYRKVCEGGNMGGCYFLGFSYIKGDGLGADWAKGVALIRKACKGGYKRACDAMVKVK